MLRIDSGIWESQIETMLCDSHSVYVFFWVPLLNVICYCSNFFPQKHVKIYLIKIGTLNDKIAK